MQIIISKIGHKSKNEDACKSASLIFLLVYNDVKDSFRGKQHFVSLLLCSIFNDSLEEILQRFLFFVGE